MGIPISQSNRPLPIEVLRFSTEHQQYPREIQILNGRRLSLVPLMGFRQFEEDSFFFLRLHFVAVAVSPAASPGLTTASSAVH
jgi:hypothetical protein